MNAQTDSDGHSGENKAEPDKQPENSRPRWQVEKYRPLLLVLARKARFAARLKNQLDASDIVQDALKKAFEGLHAFEGATEAELIGWLQQILNRTFLDAYRRLHAVIRDVDREESLYGVMTQSTAQLDGFLVDRKNPSPSDKASHQEFLMRLARAIEELSAEQRDVLILVGLMETKVQEVAAQLEIPPKTVAMRLQYARKKLRELLGEVK